MEWYTVCVGTGEIGKPMYELLSGVYKTLPIDPAHYPENQGELVDCNFMHVCIPGELEYFDETVLDYIHQYEPDVVFIHSTVVPGTTRRLNDRLKTSRIMFSPVHGKHRNNQMKKDMLRYPKYLGYMKDTPTAFIDAAHDHLYGAGFADIRMTDKPENVEWSKVLSTTQFGLIVAWTQEVERICDEFNLDYDYVTDFFSIQEDSRGAMYPGFIGGHCVMPNIKIIKEIWQSYLLDWIEKSNEMKKWREDGQN
jgi:UDP-N-acetyl-D-mannosaminuronate dehydrogenase